MTFSFYELKRLEYMHNIKRNNSTWSVIAANFLVYLVYFDSRMTIDNLSALVTTAGGGFLSGILVGWALKKVVKLFAIIAGLFLAGLTILQYQQIASVNWNKLEQKSEETINAVLNATVRMIDSGDREMTGLAITNFGIPVTSSVSVGFTIGFMKG
jgi:uncharacterized membrane protein (Fun14 family)